MSMLVSEIDALASNPWAWGVVGLLGLLAVHSLALLFLCPYAKGTAVVSDEEVAGARDLQSTPGARFALTMLAGAGLTVVGLFMIARGISPALALAAVMAGVLLIQTEPTRLLIREHKYALMAHRDSPEDIREGDRARLRGSHRALAATNVALMFAVTAALLAF